MSPEELSLAMEGLLGRLREETQAAEEKELLLAAIDAVRFISSTGQSYAFEDYRQSLDANVPPRVVAAFATREQADAWLKGHPSPPHLAYVLIAGEYHIVLYLRGANQRSLLPHPALTGYLREMMRDGEPPAVATFNTREEAETWLAAWPEPPTHAFILIAGAHHLAVYHRNVNHRAIYPVSIVQGPGPR